jgi:hypothetical protein
MIIEEDSILLIISDPIRELRESPASGRTNVLATSIKLLDEERHQTIHVNLDGLVTAILIRNGSQCQDSCLL